MQPWTARAEFLPAIAGHRDSRLLLEHTGVLGLNSNCIAQAMPASDDPQCSLCSLQHEAFPVLLPSLVASPRDKEVSEFRSLLQTVFSCLKSVLYCMVAFHTNRGLQAPVRVQTCLSLPNASCDDSALAMPSSLYWLYGGGCAGLHKVNSQVDLGTLQVLENPSSKHT